MAEAYLKMNSGNSPGASAHGLLSKRQVHFIGIGGIGMSGIAQLLLQRGIAVSGSDLRESQATRELLKLGAQVSIGHHSLNLGPAEAVVYSSAIREDNPEIIEAKKKNIPLVRRAQALAELMADKNVITVTGSHGKTTTTSLASYLLLEAGLCPSMAIGGIFKNIGNNACTGNGRFFVAEADESDGSFLYYQPDYSIITNIDREHLDYYGDFQKELSAFGDFILRTKNNGCLIACSDDRNLKQLVSVSGVRSIFFGMGEGADIRPRNIEMQGFSADFECLLHGQSLGRFHLSLAGRHNISNALAVIALGRELGIEVKFIRQALSQFKGAGRRMEVKFDGEFFIVDDYAHHPTEIKATLSALRDARPGRIIALFQPHRYSRTRLLMEDFPAALEPADMLILTDIYPAGEHPIAGVSSRGIFDLFREKYPDKPALYLPKEEIIGAAMEAIRPQDTLITLGAGDITKICDALVEAVKRQRQPE